MNDKDAFKVWLQIASYLQEKGKQMVIEYSKKSRSAESITNSDIDDIKQKIKDKLDYITNYGQTK